MWIGLSMSSIIQPGQLGLIVAQCKLFTNQNIPIPDRARIPLEDMDRVGDTEEVKEAQGSAPL